MHTDGTRRLPPDPLKRNVYRSIRQARFHPDDPGAEDLEKRGYDLNTLLHNLLNPLKNWNRQHLGAFVADCAPVARRQQ